VAFRAFEVSLFAKNLNNTQTVFQRPSLVIPTEAYTMRPRTIGLAVNYSPANK